MWNKRLDILKANLTYKIFMLIFRTVTFFLLWNLVLIVIDRLSSSLGSSLGLRSTKQQCPYMG